MSSRDLPAVARLAQRPGVRSPGNRPIIALEPGDKVTHESFGLGTVLGVEGEGDKTIAKVDFGSEGEKRLLLRYAPVEKALTPVAEAGGAQPERPAFVLHDHRVPRPHFDLRLEIEGVLRSWAVPRGLPTDVRHDRLAVAVPDHDLDHLTYTDADKSVADTGWWELESLRDTRFRFVLHGRDGARRYALIHTDAATGGTSLAAAPGQGPAERLSARSARRGRRARGAG
ncbi:hypothetical protein GCM10025868_34400 [Angustibacter aerolatus]|uniref:DNA ligase D 3'-phosphoesterase domain-containing protein n=1 Tax=Angustibacter aerolatus TaxID=1162965 RepID=A0ABQ6JLR5_9ACTN|nr:hypothetical protein GCM10025868_34400 [Angustibacter aerolatus]